MKMKKRQEPHTRLWVAHEDYYRQMVAEIRDFAIISLNRDGYIQDWNKGAENLTFYKAEEIIGKHYSQLYLGKGSKGGLRDEFLDQVVKNGSISRETWRVRKDGSSFLSRTATTAILNPNGEVTGFAEVTHDLTYIRSAERQHQSVDEELSRKNEALGQSEQLYHQMIAEVKDYAIIMLDKEGYIRNWNAGAQDIKGYSTEVIGQHFSIFYTPEDQRNHLPQTLLVKAMESGRAVHEGWRVRKDKSRFWGSIVITSLHDQHGQLIGFTKVTRDLTSKKLAEDKLLAYAAELESRNKELQQFTYITSHDLQEPLRKIRTFAETGRRSVGNVEKLNMSLERIEAAAQRMTALIRSVVDYTDLSQNNSDKSGVNLNDVLKEVLGGLSERIETANANITSSLLPVIEANSMQMRQLLSHLIDNTLKFSGENPVLTISARIIEREEVLDPSTHLTAEKYHELQFKDNGIGFDPQYHKQIFRIFQRLHTGQTFPGTGVGLALAKKIMENHQGHITARSELGKGASFYVYLPV